MRSALEKAISTYGLYDLNPILSLISTFDDVLVFGKAFLTNKLYRSVSYLGMFGKAEDTFGHDKERKRLLECHALRCFTNNGQVNLCLMDPFTKEEVVMQKSYISFLCEVKLATNLLPKLRERNDIIYLVLWPDGKKEHNFPTHRVNLTKQRKTNGEWHYYTNMRDRWTHEEMVGEECTTNSKYSDEVKLHENYNAILRDCVYITFCCKKYNDVKESAEILLEMLRY